MAGAPCRGMARQSNTQARAQLLYMRAHSCLHSALADLPIRLSGHVTATASNPV